VTPTEELDAMTRRLVKEADDELRIEARLLEQVGHAIERGPTVAAWCRTRWSDTQEGDLQPCALPAGHRGRHVA
jgi:hypothetical protein